MSSQPLRPDSYRDCAFARKFIVAQPCVPFVGLRIVLKFAQQILQIEAKSVHYDGAIRIVMPEFLWFIPIQFNTVAVGIIEIKRFGY